MRLIVVRHGETSYNAEDRFTGQADIPLSALGERQAHLVGAYLATERFDAIVSSDLQRARITALAIASHHHNPIQEDAQLRELGLGKWEGMLKTEVEASDAETLRLWRSNPSLYAPEGGETLVTMRTRIKRALDHWYMRYPQGTVAWVVHAGLIGVLICHVLDIDLNRRWQFHHDNASVTELLIDGPRISLGRLNETAFLWQHLRESQRNEVN